MCAARLQALIRARADTVDCVTPQWLIHTVFQHPSTETAVDPEPRPPPREPAVAQGPRQVDMALAPIIDNANLLAQDVGEKIIINNGPPLPEFSVPMGQVRNRIPIPKTRLLFKPSGSGSTGPTHQAEGNEDRAVKAATRGKRPREESQVTS